MAKKMVKKKAKGMFNLSKKQGAPANMPQDVKIVMSSRSGRDNQSPLMDNMKGINQQIKADSKGFKSGNEKY